MQLEPDFHLARNGRPFELVEGDKVFVNCSLRGRDKIFLWVLKYFICLKEGSLDEKFENSKLVRVCCKISIQSHLLCVYRYRVINHYLLY